MHVHAPIRPGQASSSAAPACAGYAACTCSQLSVPATSCRTTSATLSSCILTCRAASKCQNTSPCMLTVKERPSIETVQLP